MTQTPAGWYADPETPDTQRYWDGVAWTDHSAPAAPVVAVTPAVVAPPRTRIVSDSKAKPIQLIIAWTITVLTVGYMLPWAIAATRGKSNSGAIGLLNLLLGWTVVGWIVAMVMACGSHQKLAVNA